MLTAGSTNGTVNKIVGNRHGHLGDCDCYSIHVDCERPHFKFPGSAVEIWPSDADMCFGVGFTVSHRREAITTLIMPL